MGVRFDCLECGADVLVDDDWDLCTQVCIYCDAEHVVELDVKIKSVELADDE